MNVREYVKDHVLLFDGAMGTYYAMRCKQVSAACEPANLTNPALILEIHREYLAAGCKALKTNTFGVNRPACHGDAQRTEQLLCAGWKLACEAAQENAFVFADIGPIEGADEATVLQEYRFVADVFLRQGATNFLFETNSTDTALRETAAYIRTQAPQAYIIVSFASQPDGYTREGLYYAELLRTASASGAFDAVGLNCVSGPRHLAELLQKAKDAGGTLCVMPNAGYPIVVHNRIFYDGDPTYFAQQMVEICATGVRIAGGCCGTTPAHIAAMHAALRALPNTGGSAPEIKEAPAKQPAQEESRLWRKLHSGQKVIAVEFDPPREASTQQFMEGAKRLQAAGVDIITIADCPIARACMDSSLLACKVKRELGMDALPHMTCRDRNLNATKALLLGLFAEGVRNVLTVTGDPIPTAERDEVKSVYQFNSRKLARYITSLGREELPAPLHVFGALNVNARNFEVELRLAHNKLENGMCGFLTQPVLTQQAFENLQHARAELDAKILGGIIPIVSDRNARYMHSEVNGILVAPEIIALYEGKTREESEALALTLSCEIAHKIAPYVDGYYLMTPFHRVGLMEQLIARLP